MKNIQYNEHVKVYHSTLSCDERKKRVEGLMGRGISILESEALESAHLISKTKKDWLKRKIAVLKQRFNQEERALLIRSHIAGIWEDIAIDSKHNPIYILADTNGCKKSLDNLSASQVIDRKGNWTQYNATFIQLGDVFADRYMDGLFLYEKFHHLFQQIENSNGIGHLIAGNHDALMLTLYDQLTHRHKNEFVTAQELVDIRTKPQIAGINEFLQGNKIVPFETIFFKNPFFLNTLQRLKIAHHENGILYVHTDITPEMIQSILDLGGVPVINEIFKEAIQQIIIGKKPSKEYQHIKHTFLSASNRADQTQKINRNDREKLSALGIKNIIHGHSDNRNKFAYTHNLHPFSENSYTFNFYGHPPLNTISLDFGRYYKSNITPEKQDYNIGKIINGTLYTNKDAL